MKLYGSKDKNHGTSLLEQFDTIINEHKDLAESRIPVVKARLEALESEHTDLRKLLTRLEKAA